MADKYNSVKVNIFHKNALGRFVPCAVLILTGVHVAWLSNVVLHFSVRCKDCSRVFNFHQPVGNVNERITNVKHQLLGIERVEISH
jgi:hypothetical protein